MKRFEVLISGTNQCIMNKLSKELNDEFKKVPKDDREKWQENNYMKKVYKDEQGKIYFPDINVLMMLINGCQKYKVPPPKSVGRSWGFYFKGCTIIEGTSFTYEKAEPYQTMVNGNPSSIKKSSKVYCVRPMFSNWQLRFNLVDGDDKLTEDILKELMEVTGKFVGLGDYRPIFGRFRVTKVKII
jgi:hypothetical protein